jgi:2',3'-cyclic-nucleotide 2'-phosphodiesterase/3'-nucleotidase
LPYDYYGDRPVDTMGLARTASMIDGFRKESTNSMLLDNGDFLQGNPMGDYMAYERGMSEGDVHPDDRGHEHAGLRRLDARQPRVQLRPAVPDEQGRRRGNFPIVCANVVDRPAARQPRDTTLVPPYVISTRPSPTARAKATRSASASSASCRRRS